MLQFTAEYWPDTNSRVEFYPTATVPDLPVTAVKIYVFQDDNLLLTHIRSRGWDLPGGHIEPGETPEQAVIRELKEETGATVKYIELIGYLKVTNEQENEKNKKYPKESCDLVYKGYDAVVNANYSFKLEASGSKFVPIDVLPRIHHQWNTAKAQVVSYAASV
jgi:nucleoside triphosphatase YtkD